MPNTATPGTPIYQVRTIIGDNDLANLIFDDPEIQVFLDVSQQDTMEAAAKCYEAIIRSKAKLAQAVKIGGYTTSQRTISELQVAADALRDSALKGMLYVGTLVPTGQNLDTYVPTWINLNDPFVIEVDNEAT